MVLSSVGPITLRNPVILASGLKGDTSENLRAAYDMGAGAVVTKSLTISPRKGNPEPTVFKLPNGGWINSVGLRNPGVEAFASKIGHPDYPVIVSLAGSIPEDFEIMVEVFDEAVAGFELNLSCPNAHGMGDYLGRDSTLTKKVVQKAKGATDLPVFVKVAIGMDESVSEAIEAGADGITAINSVRAVGVNPDTGKPYFDDDMGGGLSGPPIKHIALREVRKFASMYGDIPIMGCGGIVTAQDAADFMTLGASAVQVGSAAMDDPSVLGRIAAGLSELEAGKAYKVS